MAVSAKRAAAALDARKGQIYDNLESWLWAMTGQGSLLRELVAGMLKEAEAKASNLFKGELQTLEACEHHFHSWRRQHRERERLETELPATAVLVQLDYAENLTIPVGPVEEQSWFWATARLSASVLCFCVRFWEDGKLRSLYLNYVSQILDHTALHAALALKDVGRNDGQFGLQKKWLDSRASRCVIGTVRELLRALSEGAESTMTLGPPPAGPEYKIDSDWRVSYRKDTPESDPLPFDLLARRLSAQQRAKTGATSRRSPLLEQLRAEEEVFKEWIPGDPKSFLRSTDDRLTKTFFGGFIEEEGWEGMSYCGGHGDRLNGMLGAFTLALLSGRAFFIDSQRPVPLSLVLQPKTSLDWRMYGSLAVLPAGFNFNDNLAAFETDPRRVLESQEKVLRIVSNQRLTPAALKSSPQRAEALGLWEPRLHQRLFELLFEPSPALLKRLQQRHLPEGRLIGLHFRAGDQMPQHWKDPPRHALAQLEEFLNCAEQLEKDQGWNATFLLFADTDKVTDLPKVQELQADGKLVLPESDGLVHLDRSPPTLTVRGVLQTWADWWTLAFDVDALVLSHSGFGATALEIGPERPAVLGSKCITADGSTG
ncbi:Uncharacterized protein SCF082_LOCUS1409 [Durusdinium trenchii]|uniref:GDP-fucose protein O-fucosyltransferase 1 n=1 Tax=Durusdinium trenchii TaxID=1381693 RepID=A0ABP0HE30_9DINO